MSSTNKKLPKCEFEKIFLTAAEEQNYVVAADCLKQGVNPNCRRTDRVTALHIAAERGDVELGKLLLRARGLNMNPFTVHGYTPLIIACNSQRAEMIEFLLKNGAGVDIPERFGKAAVHHTALIDNIPIMDILLKYGANVNLMDTFYHTPLSIAVVNRHYLPMVEFLINRGASITLNRGDMVLPLFLEACLACCNESSLEVIEYLLLVGINPNTKELRTDRNAFHYFAINSYLPLGRLLEKWGTDVSHIDTFSLTPFTLAKQHENLEAADFLEDLEFKARRSSKSQSAKAVTFGR